MLATQSHSACLLYAVPSRVPWTLLRYAQELFRAGFAGQQFTATPLTRPTQCRLWAVKVSPDCGRAKTVH